MDQPDYTKSSSQRGLGLQVAIAATLGLSALISFSVGRRSWPKLYSARTIKCKDLPKLPSSLLGWFWALHKTTDGDVLEYAGLDAYVFLMFFRAAFEILLIFFAISSLVIGPLRWYYTGRYDDGEPGPSDRYTGSKSSLTPTILNNFHWVYIVFTYLFTYLCVQVLSRYTKRVVKVRQEYLGSQNSITDRTLRLTGIPEDLRSTEFLATYLKVTKGEPVSVKLCYDWSVLDKLFAERKRTLLQLENAWAEYLKPLARRTVSNSIVTSSALPEPEVLPSQTDFETLEQLTLGLERPRVRIKRFRFWTAKVDPIEFWTHAVRKLDMQIETERTKSDRHVSSTAFVTMDSVQSCQIAAQSRLCSKPHNLLPHLAPAPHDVIWRNTYLSNKERSIRTYIVTAISLTTTLFLSVPVTYLARLLDINTIAKLSPWLGDLLKRSPWIEAFFTEVFTTYIFSLLNLVVPYFYDYLSKWQGHISREDVELSSVSKNFFYLLINLFLVFTIASNYISLLRDTTQIAVQLADALRRLSAFYTNLIVFQGIGIMPIRLMQAGSILQFPFFKAQAKSARDYYNLYKPQKLNYGILLPTPLLILIVTIMYSILNGKILFFGFLYFGIGYYVYKYQCLYSMVHPQHSTGRLWTLISRRIYVGLLLFQLAMFGILVIEAAWTTSFMILPSLMITVSAWYDFERFVEPLLRFIALETTRPADPLDRFEDVTISTPSPAESVAVEYQLDDEELLGNTWRDPNDSFSSTAAPIANVDFPTITSSRHRANTSLSVLFDELPIGAQTPSEDGQSSTREPLMHRMRHRISRTLDEERELGQRYVNPATNVPLEGPWVCLESDKCVYVKDEALFKRRLSFSEWE